MRIFKNFRGIWGPGTQERVKLAKQNNHVLAYLYRKLCIFDMADLLNNFIALLEYVKILQVI